MKPKALVLTGFGVNCDYETQHAFQLAGAQADRIHLNDVVSGKKKLSDYHILALPGGFSFGDDLGSGKVFANKIKYFLKNDLMQFVQQQKLVIGICNGFQSLVKMGLLPALDGKYFEQQATLTFNDSGRFENRWVWLKIKGESKSVFTKGIEKLYLPVRHGEGKFFAQNGVLEKIFEKQLVAAQYIDPEGGLAGFPWNPNGSMKNVAAICNETGTVFGLMPHPEAFLYKENHPRWTRGEAPEQGMGLQVFKNAVEYCVQKL